MNKTLLLDLDDTLLNSNMDEFIPAYFQLLSLNLQDIIEPGIMLNGLMNGTNKMLKKTSPLGSLSDIFSAEFYELIQVPEVELTPRLDYFYDEVFPCLGSLTTKKPDAIEFVKKAFEEYNNIVIATNPLFPLKAVEHRLRWAGLPPEDYNYSLITAFEDFHFAKENISYFSEIYGWLGWPDGPVVMIGNDFNMDIDPARKAGFPVFWVPDQPDSISINKDIPSGQLNDVFPWMDEQPIMNLSVSLDNLISLKSTLSATPAVFQGWKNPMGKFTPPDTNSITNSINEAVSELTEIELRNLQILVEFLQHNKIDQQEEYRKLESLQMSGDTVKNASLNNFLILRQQLLYMIGVREEAIEKLNKKQFKEFIEILKRFVSQDINYIRIAYKSFDL